MTPSEARGTIAMVMGYWSTPACPDEEAAAWLRGLTAAPLRITPQEARTVIDEMVRSGGRFRPRPGELISAVQALRRHRKLMTPTPTLAAAPVGFEADPEGFREGLAMCRRALADA